MPEWTGHLRPRLAALRLDAVREQEIVDELSQHLDLRYEELRAAGVTDVEALGRALDELREPEELASHMRVLRQAHVPPPIDPGVAPGFGIAAFWQDLRYAARMLRKQPGFAATAILTLALGIGTSTAIFSLVDAAVLRALPFENAERVVAIWADNPTRSGGQQYPPANADVAAWRAHTDSFERIAAFLPASADVASGGEAERVGAAGVTAGFFETLGVTPLLGRTLTPDEEAPGGPPVLLIGHALWQRRFDADPEVVGKGALINGRIRTIVGVLPPDFDFPRGAEWPAVFPFAGRTEAWLPLGFRPREDGSGWSNWESRNERGLVVIGRVKPGVDLRLAQAEMDTFAVRRATDHPDTHQGTTIKLVPLGEQLAGHVYRPLLMLSGVVGLLLVIACVNVANLLLARGVTRRQETAVRAALGANGGRLVRQLLTECLLLATLASVVGVAIASVCLKVFLTLNPATHSRLDEASLNPVALGFALCAALLTSVIFGLAPAFQAARFDLRTPLHEGGRGGNAGVRERLRTSLVAAQVALALVLLAAAGLAVRSVLKVQAVQTGFRSDSVLAFNILLTGQRYSNEASQVALFEQLTDRLQALPGVRSAGAISILPLGGGQNRGSFVVEADPPPAPGREPRAERRWVTPGYFAAMGIPISKGRVFTPQDRGDHPRVIVVNDALVRQFFGSRDPLGQQVRVLGRSRTVIGVVADVKSSSLEADVGPQIYVPHAQTSWAGMTVVVHADGNPLALVPAVRGEMKALDAQIPVANVRTMEQVLSKASSARRFNMALLAFFGGAALLLTLLGIYGVVAFVVGRRVREIGIRVALGARRRDVLLLIVRQGMMPVGIGVVVGLLASLAASRVIESQLYGVSPTDPLTLGGIVTLLAIGGLFACWLPARRAAAIDPLHALRCD